MGFWRSILNAVLTVARHPLLRAVAAVVPMVGVFATALTAVGEAVRLLA